MALQASARVVEGNSPCAFKNLNDHTAAFHLHHTSLPQGSVVQTDIHNLLKGCALHVVKDDQRAIDLAYAQIIYQHCFSRLLAASRRYQFGQQLVNLRNILVKEIQPVVRNVVFHLDQLVKQSCFQNV